MDFCAIIERNRIQQNGAVISSAAPSYHEREASVTAFIYSIPIVLKSSIATRALKNGGAE